jgi:thiamine-monophosphate kinase
MTLEELGESGLLELLKDWTHGASKAVRLGIGDDAAILEVPPGRQLVVSTDAWVSGVHFSTDYLKPDEIGHRVMAGSLSDLAAMGADPIAAFVNIHAPGSTEVDFLRRVYLGMERVGGPSGAVIAGGDTTRGELAFDVTVLGTVERGAALRRSGAKPGDVICVTGELGAAEAGRRSLGGELSEPLPGALREAAENAHRLPRPRFDVARLLTTLERRTVDVELERETVEPARATAAMDISDGLGIDLGRLCEASRVGCRVEQSRIPVHPSARRVARIAGEAEYELALSGGDDYELLFTMAPADVEHLLEKVRKAKLAITPIGTITPAREGRHRVDEAGKSHPLSSSGWDHFRG